MKKGRLREGKGLLQGHIAYEQHSKHVLQAVNGKKVKLCLTRLDSLAMLARSFCEQQPGILVGVWGVKAQGPLCVLPLIVFTLLLSHQ